MYASKKPPGQPCARLDRLAEALVDQLYPVIEVTEVEPPQPQVS